MGISASASMAMLWALIKSAFGFAGKTAAKVVVVGLDGSGKTTILNHLKPDSVSREQAAIETIETAFLVWRRYPLLKMLKWANGIVLDANNARRFRHMRWHQPWGSVWSNLKPILSSFRHTI